MLDSLNPFFFRASVQTWCGRSRSTLSAPTCLRCWLRGQRRDGPTAACASGRRRDARDVGGDVHGLLIVPAGTLGMDMGGGCSEKDNVACA